MIGGAQLLAGLLLVSLQQSTTPPADTPADTPAAAVAGSGPTPPPSATGDPPLAVPAAAGSAAAAATPGVPAAPQSRLPPGSPPAAPEPTTPRITFTVPFPSERGGGAATGSAGALDYQREDFAVLTDGVRLHYQDIDLAADMLTVDLNTKETTAVGHVVIDQGPSRLTGSSATFNLDTKLGSLRQAAGAAQPGLYFAGERVDKVGEDEYVIENGTFTACAGDRPAWSFRVGRARIRLEDYAHVKSASMRVKNVPLVYIPYMIWPTKSDRASGLLVPKIGSSGIRGAYLGLAYYQVLGRSWDTTLFGDIYSKGYYGIGNELRYRPSDGTSGAFRAYAVHDPLPSRKDLRYKVRWDHVTNDLPLGLRGVVQFEDYSDFNYFRDFERGLDAKAKNSIYSDAFVTGNRDNQSLNMLADRRRTFLTQDDIIDLRRLPEVQYKLRPTRLGATPVYLSFDSSADYLSVDRGLNQSDYPRFYVLPQLRVPLTLVPWLSATFNGGYNATWYGDKTATTLATPTAPSRSTFCSSGNAAPGECDSKTLNRNLPFGGVQVIGPSLSRIIDRPLGPFAKLKHIVEPRFSYSYQGSFDDQNRVPIFDEVDFQPAGGFTIGQVALINRLLAKPTDPNAGSAREILSLELSRNYSFDAAQPLEAGPGTHSALGPLRASLRAYPSNRFGLRLEANYSMLFQQLTGLQASGNIAFGKQRFDFTWTPSWRATTGEVLTNQGTFGTTLQLLGGHLNLSSYLTYDFEKTLLRDQRHLITWLGSCYGIHLELHESTITNVRRRDYVLSVDLKNVGTFLDLNGGETTGL